METLFSRISRVVLGVCLAIGVSVSPARAAPPEASGEGASALVGSESSVAPGDTPSVVVPLPERYGLNPLAVGALNTIFAPIGLGHALVGQPLRGLALGGIGIGLVAAALPIYGFIYGGGDGWRHQMGYTALIGGGLLPAIDAWAVATDARKADAVRNVDRLALSPAQTALLKAAIVRVPEDALVASLGTSALALLMGQIYWGTSRGDAEQQLWAAAPLALTIPGWTNSQRGFRSEDEARWIALQQGLAFSLGLYGLMNGQPGWLMAGGLILPPIVLNAWETWHKTVDAREAGIRKALAAGAHAGFSTSTDSPEVR
jgi:hypothetical protein